MRHRRTLYAGVVRAAYGLWVVDKRARSAVSALVAEAVRRIVLPIGRFRPLSIKTILHVLNG